MHMYVYCARLYILVNQYVPLYAANFSLQTIYAELNSNVC